MSKKKDPAIISQHLQALGVPQPEADSAAKMEIESGISQYPHYAFLHGAWSTVVREGDREWMDFIIERASENPTEPGAGAGFALKRLLAAGVDPADITELVRVMQWEVIQSICYQLEDFDSVDYPNEDMPHAKWALMELNDKDKPVGQITGLHELVLLTEPSKREMRPKPE